MSLAIDLTTVSEDTLKELTKELTIDVSPKRKGKFQTMAPQKKLMSVFDVNGNIGYIPFFHGKRRNIPSLKHAHKSIDCPFVGTLREEQKTVKSEAIALLNTVNTLIISCYPGFGKTLMSIYIASKAKLQTLVVINLLVLKDQWIESINKVCPSASICFLQPTKKNDFEADFLIVNAINIPKFGRDVFKSVGTVIVDEVHLIMSEVLSQSLYYLTPKYLIGLSATPYRNDGMDSLLNLFFSENRIVRKMYRKHLVHKITTNISPAVDYDKNGTVNWNSIIESISNNDSRNNMIVDIIKTFGDRNFLVLCKRTSQARYIHEKLLQEGELSTLYIESCKSFDKSARILVGTIKKLGVGFDFPKLDALIPAIDLESYFIQYLGRVFRSPEGVDPIVFDFLDVNPILKKHYKTREKVYKESGGEIRDFFFQNKNL